MSGKKIEEEIERYADGTPIQRYPKWIVLPDGRTRVIVQNKKEHDAALGIVPTEEKKPSELDTKKKSAWDNN